MLWDNIAALLRERGQLKSIKTSEISKLAKWICGDYKPMLLLTGTCGNGKTTAAKALKMVMESLYCCNMQDAHGNIHTIGMTKEQGSIPSVQFLSSAEIRQTAINNLDDLDRIKKARFLFIDDLGMEAVSAKHYGNELSPVADVLYYRYENMLFTVTTSNLNRDELGQRYGSRIDSRLSEVMDVINFNSQDFRKQL